MFLAVAATSFSKTDRSCSKHACLWLVGLVQPAQASWVRRLINGRCPPTRFWRKPLCIRASTQAFAPETCHSCCMNFAVQDLTNDSTLQFSSAGSELNWRPPMGNWGLGKNWSCSRVPRKLAPRFGVNIAPVWVEFCGDTLFEHKTKVTMGRRRCMAGCMARIRR